MNVERRLVWRVLRYWEEIADSGRFPRRDEIEPWFLGEDGANCLLIAVESPIELSHFVVVGVNLAVALCPTDTLAGVLLSAVPQVVSARRGLMIEGVATLRGMGILYRTVLLPTLGSRRRDRSRLRCHELSLAALERGVVDAGQFPSLAGTAERRLLLIAARFRFPLARSLAAAAQRCMVDASTGVRSV